MIVCGEESTKRFKIYLEIIKNMASCKYDRNQIYGFMLDIEKEIIAFYKQHRNIKTIELSRFYSCDKLKNIEIPLNTLPTNNYFPNGIYCSEMTDLFDDVQFDINRIDELINLLIVLDKYKIQYAQIGDLTVFDNPNYFLSTVVPDNFDEVWDFNTKNRLDHVPIFKTYANQEIIYKNLNDIEEYCYTERNAMYHYLASFRDIPTWVINGEVQVYRDKTIYYGNSSPHTHFNFRSTSFYINPLEFPTYDELYSIKQVKSLNKRQINK